MFAKLLDNLDLPFKQQKEILKTVLTTNLKQNVHEVRLQFNHNYLKLKPILIQHWKYALRIALALHTWQVAAEMLEGKRQTQAIDLLYQLFEKDAAARGQHLMTQLSKSYQDNWRILVILSLASEIVAKHTIPQDYCWFIPTFVRLAATIIQGYLTLKNQPTKQNNDRVESDLKLVTNCEQWVTKSFIAMISSLKPPKSLEQKHTVLAGFSQICGALLQNQKGGQLLVQHLQNIEKVAADYIISTFSLKEVGNLFLAQLKSRNYSTRLQKIEVPDQYNEKSEFAKEGICWILLQFLKGETNIYSDQFKLWWLLVVFSECLESPLPLKQEALASIKTLVKNSISWNSWALEYPAGLFLFNIYHSFKHQFEFFKQKLEIGTDPANDLRIWIRLLNLDLGHLNVDKTSFAVSQLSEASIKEKEVLLLIKAIKFDFASQELCNSVTTLLTSSLTTHPDGKKSINWLIKRQKSNNRNLQLCTKLEQLLQL